MPLSNQTPFFQLLLHLYLPVSPTCTLSFFLNYLLDTRCFSFLCFLILYFFHTSVQCLCQRTYTNYILTIYPCNTGRRDHQPHGSRLSLLQNQCPGTKVSERDSWQTSQQTERASTGLKDWADPSQMVVRLPGRKHLSQW